MRACHRVPRPGAGHDGRRKNANHVNRPTTQIITALIADHAGLTAAVDSTSINYKELVQYYVSDWDYMLARAEANGPAGDGGRRRGDSGGRRRPAPRRC